jgi:hypothetical protein
MNQLYGMWDNSKDELIITRPNGQKYRVRGTAALAGSHQVFAVETVGNEIHVLTGPKSNRTPNRRVKYSDSGTYKGSSSL